MKLRISAAILAVLISHSARAEKTVFVLLSSDSTIYEEGLAGIRSSLNMEIRSDYFNAISAERQDIAAYFREIESGSSAIITLGPQASLAAAQNVRGIPVIFSMVNNPKAEARNMREVCGVSMDVPISLYFQTLREFYPAAKRIHAFYSTDDGEFLASEGEYSDLSLKFIYTKERISADGFEAALERIKGRTDAFYMVPDPIYNSARFQQLSEFARANHIVLMTPFRTLVRLGAAFGYSPDYGKIGMLTGQMTRRILQGGSSCVEEGIQLPDLSSFFFYLNESYSVSSGFTIPRELLDRARLMGLLQSGVRLTAESKFNTAQSIFQEILRRDPNNTTAQYYQDYILNRLTGDQIERLMLEAGLAMKSEQFAVARNLFQRVLTINPKIREAREGVDRSLFLQSESERLTGNAFFAQGKAYDGIRFVQTSLGTYPGNTQAQADLARMRYAQLPVIPAYFEEGLKLYNSRDYESSEQVFNNILLVDPANRQAIEYLRLSKLKKEALTRLLDKLHQIQN